MHIPQDQKRQQTLFLLSLAAVVFVFSFLSSITYLWYPGGVKILPSGSYGALVALVMVLVAALLGRGTRPTTAFDPRAGAVGIALVFFSDWLCRGYGFLQGPSIRGEILLGAALGFLLLRSAAWRRCWLPIFWIAIAGCLYCFFMESRGRLLFSDDHGTFLYRLTLLKENFPYIPFYNPEWNGGLDARDAFATGVLNMFFLSLPWIYFFDVEAWYTAFIAGLLFVLFPLVTVYAGRLAGIRKELSWIAGILVLANGLHWYRWGLKYGTMGFVTGALFLPLIISSTARVLESGQVRRRDSIVMVVSLFLAFCWPFFGVVLLPLIVACAWTLYRSFRERAQEGTARFRRLLTVGIVLIVLQLPLMLVFVGTSNLGSFLGKDKQADQAAVSVDVENASVSTSGTERRFRKKVGTPGVHSTLEALRTVAFSSNPILLFLGLGGIFLLQGWQRRLLVFQVGWFFLLGAVLYPVKPQLELDRMLVLMLLLLAVPAARSIEVLIEKVREQQRLFWNVLAALVLGFLYTAPLVVWSILRNRTVEQYVFADAMVEDFKLLLGAYQPEGRILFSGCILHEYGGGHLAPLAHQSHHPMVASSQAHTLWWYRDVVPSEFLLRGDKGKEDYFDLYNVSDIFAHEKNWKRYFRRRPDHYEQIWSGHGFDLFRRKNVTPSYFLAGSGEVLDQLSDGIRLRLDSRQAVIKFRYNVALEAPGCTISGKPVYPGVSFIQLSDCEPGSVVYIRQRPPWQQLFLPARKSIQ